MSEPKRWVSSRGIAFGDADRERALLKQVTRFVCGLCGYPVFSSWQFCPGCGGLLEWKELTEVRDEPGRTS